MLNGGVHIIYMCSVRGVPIWKGILLILKNKLYGNDKKKLEKSTHIGCIPHST